MDETNYNALLYDKMKAEQDKHRDWLHEGGHRDVYGRTGAFSETGKGTINPLSSERYLLEI